MTIQQCKYVLEIARCGSFHEAAKQLFVAQSSLSVSVKSLEQELGIQIFERSGSGICLTEAGAEFARYARQIAAQSDFIARRYTAGQDCCRLYVATQHYDFVADVFAKLLRERTESHYRFSLREMKTHDVIAETCSAYSDVGILAIKGSDYSVMERYLTKNGLVFTPIFKVRPHVYLRRNHPLAGASVLTAVDLKPYPCLCYEQGEHNATFFMEEIGSLFADKQVEITDRASLMNVLLTTDGYTVGTGRMPSQLNQGRIIGVPFESDDDYTVGYILRADQHLSELTKQFLASLITHTAAY